MKLNFVENFNQFFSFLYLILYEYIKEKNLNSIFKVKILNYTFEMEYLIEFSIKKERERKKKVERLVFF
jgi:hypothetical protein